MHFMPSRKIFVLETILVGIPHLNLGFLKLLFSFCGLHCWLLSLLKLPSAMLSAVTRLFFSSLSQQNSAQACSALSSHVFKDPTCRCFCKLV